MRNLLLDERQRSTSVTVMGIDFVTASKSTPPSCSSGTSSEPSVAITSPDRLKKIVAMLNRVRNSRPAHRMMTSRSLAGFGGSAEERMPALRGTGDRPLRRANTSTMSRR